MAHRARKALQDGRKISAVPHQRQGGLHQLPKFGNVYANRKELSPLSVAAAYRICPSKPTPALKIIPSTVVA